MAATRVPAQMDLVLLSPNIFRAVQSMIVRYHKSCYTKQSGGIASQLNGKS